jgi:hypothetical protein
MGLGGKFISGFNIWRDHDSVDVPGLELMRLEPHRFSRRLIDLSYAAMSDLSIAA